MIQKQHFSNYYYFCILAIILTTFTALQSFALPNSLPSNPAANLSNNRAACEAKLKKAMLQKTIKFKNYPDSMVDDQFELYNNISGITNVSYSYAQVSGKTTSLEVNHKIKDKAELTYSLGEGDKDTGSTFAFEVSYEGPSFQKPNEQVEISQAYNVSSECKLKIFNAIKMERKKINTGVTSIHNEVTVYDGTDQITSKEFQTPDGSEFLDNKYVDSFFDARMNGYIIMENEVVKVQTKKTPITFNLGFLSPRLTEAFGMDIRMFNKSEEFFRILELGDKNYDEGMVAFLSFGVMEFRVNFDMWSLQSLGSQVEIDASYKVSLESKDYESTKPLQILVNTTSPLQYEHLNAYWKIDSIKNKKNNDYSYILTEGSGLVISKPSTQAELQNTEALEYTSPEIQLLVREILAKNPKSRSEKVRFILEKINELIKYDNKMVDDGKVRLLRATDILKRGAGVCQHYSVLFVSLARAMGVPSIIVNGLSLGDGKAIVHAWVEYEDDPGFWFAVEPQGTSILMERTNAYLPLRRSLSVEQGYLDLLEFKNFGFKVEISKKP